LKRDGLAAKNGTKGAYSENMGKFIGRNGRVDREIGNQEPVTEIFGYC
jgi:hypothetical protein